MRELELVLPCYNESKSIHEIVQRAIDAAREQEKSPQQFQLVLVENGSKDDSLQVMQALKATPMGAWFRIVEVKVNSGYGNGLFQGLKSCTETEFLGWSHADEQTDPADAFKALQIVKQSADPQKTLAKGFRQGRDPKDNFVSLIFRLLATVILGVRLNEINAQPKVFHKNLLPLISHPPLNFAFDLYVLYRGLRHGWKLVEFPVQFPPRKHGSSNWAATFLGRYKTILGMIGYMCHLRRTKGDRV